MRRHEGGPRSEQKSLSPQFNVRNYILGAEIHEDFRRFTLDRDLLLRFSADVLVDNPAAEKDHLAPRKIFKREVLKDDLLAAIPKNVDEFRIDELVGESEEMNTLLLEVGTEAIRAENGVIVVVNTQSPKSIGLERGSLYANGLYVAKYTGLRENPEDYEKARQVFGRINREGVQRSHHNGFIAFLKLYESPENPQNR